MTGDVVGGAMAAVASNSLWSPLLAFCAGVVTSAGPCAAPRYAAMVGLAQAAEPRRRRARLASFGAGLCLGYAVLAMASGWILRLVAVSAYTYAAMAAALLAFGARSLWTEQCSRCDAKATPASSGAALLLGISLALVASPCCTPFVTALAMGVAPDWKAALAAAVCFALGHLAPVALLGALSSALATRFDLRGAAPAMQTIGGAVSLALAGYYALLA